MSALAAPWSVGVTAPGASGRSCFLLCEERAPFCIDGGGIKATWMHVSGFFPPSLSRTGEGALWGPSSVWGHSPSCNGSSEGTGGAESDESPSGLLIGVVLVIRCPEQGARSCAGGVVESFAGSALL